MSAVRSHAPIDLDSIRSRATISAPELARLLDLDHDSTLKALHAGELPGFRVGRLWRIPVPSLLAKLGAPADNQA